MISHFAYTWLGVGSGPANTAYSFWSGFGSCLTYLAVFAAAYRHFKCATCWRPAPRHKVPETGQRTCDKHTTAQDHAELRRRHHLKFPQHLAHRESR
jgi:hypothetical protein